MGNKYDPYKKNDLAFKQGGLPNHKWSDYEPYPKKVFEIPKYVAYEMDYNPLIDKGPVCKKENLKQWKRPRVYRLFRFRQIIPFFEQFFADIKFMLSDIKDYLFKRNKIKK